MPLLRPMLKLPRLEKVSLRRFSLYTANPNAEFLCGHGVLCLVGANGVGKSTLLSAINFCLTGVVPDPNRTFVSMEEYYKFSRTYSSNYFRGRILGTDEDDAEVAVHFQLGPVHFEVRRGLFEPDELRGLTVTDGESKEILIATEEMTRSERQQVYIEHFLKYSGLSSFDEFVFLQHFVFTFDEQRKTIFWNSRIMDRVLYRAFGLDPGMAKRADSLKREIEHEDSKVRNYQFEWTRMTRRINEIRTRTQAASGAAENYNRLIEDHEALNGQFEQESKELSELRDALNDANLRLAENSVRETALRDEYAAFFDLGFDRRPSLAQHPMLTQSVANHECGLCGNNTDSALAIIKAKSHDSACPLCDSDLPQVVPRNEDITRLQQIDAELAHAKDGIRDVLKTLEGLRAAEAKARSRFEATKEKLDEFDRQNSTTLESLRNLLNHSTGEASLVEYREQLAVLERDKKTAYDRREKLKANILELQKNLEQHYLQVETNFVPQFATLAQHFLGMPLTVQMDARVMGEIKLIVTVRGTTRRQQQNLSESQRFFLDIALRMALTQHMSDPTSQGSMFIDTPEGSLDIAYEKRAGDMLAMFASAGHPIVMTANLNSSKLLLALARQCGHKHMRLCRMTDWSELSEVQQQEEALFDEAYDSIEQAMGIDRAVKS